MYNRKLFQIPKDKGILFFSLTEIAIGAVTLCAVLTSLVLHISTKPLNVLIFVIAASLISLGLGIGIIRCHIHSYHMLLFFAGAIILSKILIFGGIITMHGALETSIPVSWKNIISLIYHILIFLYFRQKIVKKEFIK